MKLFKMITRSILPPLLIMAVISSSVFAAAIYYADITVQESDGNSYSYLPVIVDVDNDYLSDNGYISLTGLDTKVLSGSTELKHLVADDKTVFVAPSISASGIGTYKYTTGNDDLDSFAIVLGYDGYLTRTDTASMELGNNFEVEFEGYVDTTQIGSILINKIGAFVASISNTGEITAGIPSGDVSLGANDEYDGTHSYYTKVCQIDTNKIAVAFMDSAYDGNVIVGTVSGTDVTWGSAVEFCGDAYVDGTSRLDICKIDTNKFAMSYIDDAADDDGYVRVGTVSGTTITLGTAVEFDNNGDAEYTSICKLDTDKFAVVYNDEAVGDDVYTIVCTVSGTTITCGSETVISTDQCTYTSCSQLDTDKYIALYSDSTVSDYYYAIITVSGTTPTVNTPVVLDGNSGEIESCYISTDKVAIVYPTGGGTCHINTEICTVSGVTLTEGSVDSVATADDLASPAICLVNANTLVVAYDEDDFALAAEAKYIAYTFNVTTLTEYDSGSVDNTDRGVYEALCPVNNNNKFAVCYDYSLDTGYAKIGDVYDFDASVTASGLSAGEMVVNIAADGTDLTIDIDGVEEDSVALAGSSVADNANGWYIMSNITPYLNYYKHTVGGTLVAWYQPISMIIGTTLDDREGTDAGETGTAEEDAAIVWGVNPAGISTEIGSLTLTSQTAITPISSDGETPDIIPSGSIPAGGSVDTEGLEDNPFYPIVEIVANTTGLTEDQIWFIAASLIIFIGMALAVVKVPNHLLLAGVIGLTLSGFFTAMGIYQWWMLLIFVFMFVASIFMERKPVF